MWAETAHTQKEMEKVMCRYYLCCLDLIMNIEDKVEIVTETYAVPGRQMALASQELVNISKSTQDHSYAT